LQAAILAGGLGTRLRPITETVPKAMVPVLGRPFIDYEIDLLKAAGVVDFVICVGHLGGMIEQHLGDGGSLGVRIHYSYDGPRLLGPAGALRRAEKLLGETFFVTYGDAYLRAPYRRIMNALVGSGKLGLMTVYMNDNRHGASDIAVRGGMVINYDKTNRSRGFRWINFGVTALQRNALKLIPARRGCGEEEFYGSLIARRQLVAFPVTKRFYEVGTQPSLAEFGRFISRNPPRSFR